MYFICFYRIFRGDTLKKCLLCSLTHDFKFPWLPYSGSLYCIFH